MKKIVLVGNPNVGKSVIFHRLTGTRVISSNYPGTTVHYTGGALKLPADLSGLDRSPFDAGETIEVIDAPGTYTLHPTSRAEEVALEIMKGADIVINVIDSTNLERNLYLTMQLLESDVPMIVALNLWDETRHRGITIDCNALEALLGVPVIPTVAVTGSGIRELIAKLRDARPGRKARRTSARRWAEIGQMVRGSQKLTHHHHTILERFEDISVKTSTGLLTAAAIVFLYFKAVRWVGEGLIAYVMDPLFNGLYLPLLSRLSSLIPSDGLLHQIAIGRLIDGRIDFMQSFGVLSTGVYIELAVVLPYVFAFYLVLGFLEDIGYLPRLAVLLDTLLHRIGLHGYAIIPNMLGLGCNVPAILATRILESRRERFIACTTISIAVPCASLQAMIFGLVGRRGGGYVAIVYCTLFMVWLTVGFILNLISRGFSPELIMEIPPYRMPVISILMKKLWVRVREFLADAMPVVLASVFVINILYATGIFDLISDMASPLIRGVLDLPRDSIAAIMVGFLRKDMAVGMLGAIQPPLTAKQLVVATTVLAMFFPCAATFAVLAKELGIRGMLRATAVMIVASIGAGAILNALL